MVAKKELTPSIKKANSLLENEFIFLVELMDSAMSDTDRAKLFLALTRTLTEAHIICGKKSPILEL